MEYENSNWVGAFNVHLSFSSLFDSMVSWFGDEPSTLPDGTELDPLIGQCIASGFTVKHVLTGILGKIYAWHQSKMLSNYSRSESTLPTAGSDEITPSFMKPPSDFSFHILFHRFFATCIKECCRFPFHNKTLVDFATLLQRSVSFEGYLAGDVSSELDKNRRIWWFYALLDYPVLNLMTASQIKLKMWARNGMCMLDQLLNYGDYPFCRIFRDSDLLLTQFCGAVVGSRLFLQHILNRFNVHSLLENKRFDLCHTDPPKSRLMVDEVFQCIIILLTELPLPPMLDVDQPRRHSMDIDDTSQKTVETGTECKEASLSMASGGINDALRCRTILRREVLHRLMAAPCNYSHLYECRSFLPGPDKNCDDIIDNIVEEVGVVNKSGGMNEITKIYLKSEYWVEYDPCFYHVTLAQHQHIHEAKPKVKLPTAICPAPPVCHDFFSEFRTSVLMDPLLLGYIRQLLYSFVALRFEKESEKKQDCFVNATTREANVSTSEACQEENIRRKRNFLSVLAVTKPWVLQCTDATYLKAIQLVTLLIHQLEYLTSKPLTPDICTKIRFLTEYILYSPYTLVPPPLAAFLDSASTDSGIPISVMSSMIQQQMSVLSSPGMSGVNTPYTMSGMNSILASAVNSTSNSANNSRRPSIDGLESIVSGVSTVFDYNQPTSVTGININFVPMHGSLFSGTIIDQYMHNEDDTATERSTDVSLYLPSLVNVLLMAHEMLQSEDDNEGKNYARWCLDKLRYLLPECDKVISEWMRHELDSERDAFMKAKRLQAKEKIIQEMEEMTKRFINGPEFDRLATGSIKSSLRGGDTRRKSDDNVEGSGETLSGVKRRAGGEFTVEDEECIICRGNNENAGMMSYLVHSHKFKYPFNGGSGTPTVDSVPLTSCSYLLYKFCGHAMHQSCFESFYPEVAARSTLQQGLLLDTRIGEFQCPLCKVLNNAIIPILKINDLMSTKNTSKSIYETRFNKQQKLVPDSDLEGIESPCLVNFVLNNPVISWISNKSPEGMFEDYVYPMSLRVPAAITIPVGCLETSSKPDSSNWISRTMSSFPIKLFGGGINAKEHEVRDSSHVLLPRPDDIASIFDGDELLRRQKWSRYKFTVTSYFISISQFQFVFSLLGRLTLAEDSAGLLMDDSVLQCISKAIRGVSCSINLEATENFPGHHLISTTSIGNYPFIFSYI